MELLTIYMESIRNDALFLAVLNNFSCSGYSEPPDDL